MTWKRSVLVVANVTATSPELLEKLQAMARDGACEFTLVVPATSAGGGRTAAEETLAAALALLIGAGLEVNGVVGPPDPIVAVTDVWDPKRYDEILVSTLPQRFSKWLHGSLPERIGKLTGAPVEHVVSEPPKPPVHASSPPAHEDVAAALGPLSVLSWGGHKHR
jgi:nucleotide-binding universal stress UspA family protein